MELTEKVLERLGTTERPRWRSKARSAAKSESHHSFGESLKVLLRNEALEVRNVDGRLHIARLRDGSVSTVADRSLIGGSGCSSGS